MRLYLKACRTTYAASTLKTLLCAALALVMAGLPACGALAAETAGSQVRVSSGFDEDLESWFRQNHPELTCVNLYDGEVVRTAEALELLQGSEPVDMLAVHSSDCDIAAILSSGLVEDLSSNEAIRQRAAELYEPVARLTVTEDGAILGVNGVSGRAMHRHSRRVGGGWPERCGRAAKLYGAAGFCAALDGACTGREGWQRAPAYAQNLGRAAGRNALHPVADGAALELLGHAPAGGRGSDCF